jgi:hypothetical protein
MTIMLLDPRSAAFGDRDCDPLTREISIGEKG